MSSNVEISDNKVRVLFCDQLNLARGKYLPVSFATNGEAKLCKGAYAVTYSRQLVAAPGTGLERGLPDIAMHFDPTEYRLGWEKDTKVAIADIYDDEEPSELCGRSALKRAIAAWKKHGLEPMIGLEGEGYIFEQTENGLKPYATPGSFVYGTGPFNDPEDLLSELWGAAARSDIEIESLNTEFDASQYELTLAYKDALKACDDFFLFRNLTREMLYKRGYLLTYMPKPLEEVGGSGLHVNISFRNTEGKNALAGGTEEGNLSKLTSGCIAGLMKHHEALGGVLAPTVNSYKRLYKGSMAGYWANWGFDHRAAAVRISAETGQASRIEHRVGDAAASPYFTVAAILQAALLGYENDYPLQEPEKEDGFEKVSVDRHICDNLSESLQALQSDEALSNAIGSGLIANYAAIKEAEVGELEGKSFEEIVEYYIHYI